MTRRYDSLRGSLHPMTAQRRLDYWQGIERSRAAEFAAREIAGGTGPDVDFQHGTIEYAFSQLVEAQIRFASYQLRLAASQPTPATTPEGLAGHTPDLQQPSQ